MRMASQRLGVGILLLTMLNPARDTRADEPAATSEVPRVSVAKPITRTVTDFAEFMGRIGSSETIDLRTTTRGYLQAIHFRDGQMVKEGDLLFEIDSRPHRLALDLANAQFAVAKAAYQRAKNDQARSRSLFEKKVISDQEVINADTSVASAEAEVLAKDILRRKAELDLSMTQVRAPRPGRIGRAYLNVGNLINVGGVETLLATIVSVDPVVVFFEVDEQSLRALRGGPLKQGVVRRPISVVLAGDREVEHQGEIDFIDNRINPQTGTVQFRGILSNKSQQLMDGAAARVRVAISEPHEALLIPASAVGADFGGRFVYVVNHRNVVSRRPVEIGATHDKLVSVIRGLAVGDQIVVNGSSRVRDGMKVEVVPSVNE